MEEFLIYVEDNLELVESVFQEYYDEHAIIEGEEMIGDERFGDDNYDEDPSELYEKYAHAVGHSAHYQGAIGVIEELGVNNGYDVESDDDELQWEIIVMLGKEY